MMKKDFNFKRAILSSVLSVTLCVAMLLGSTMAWFTSTAENKGNRIEAGILDVDLLMYKDKAEGEGQEYVSIKGSTAGDIFSEAAGNGTKWEPGKTEIVYLQVKNTGSLAFKYQIKLNITGGGTDATDVTLASALEYAVLDGVQATDASLASVTSWADIKGIEGVQTGSVRDAISDSTVADNGKLSAEGSDYFALAVHMNEDAGNEYMDKALAIDVKVVAGQTTDAGETDSFGGTYDGGEDVPYYIPENLVIDGSFNSGKIDKAYWYNHTVSPNVATVAVDPDGGYCLALNRMDNSKTCGIQLLSDGGRKALEAGKTYKVSAKVKAEGFTDSGTNIVYLRLDYYPTEGATQKNKWTIKKNGSEVTEWTEISTTVTLEQDYKDLVLYLYANNTGTVYYDDIKIELVEE